MMKVLIHHKDIIINQLSPKNTWRKTNKIIYFEVKNRQFNNNSSILQYFS